MIDTHLDAAWAEEKGRDFDWLFAAQRDGAERLKQAGLPAHWLPLACDPEIHRPHPLGKHWDFGFVGTPSPGPRGDLLALLHRQIPQLIYRVGRISKTTPASCSQSWLGFNRSLKNDVNMRVFETPACGTLLITNDLRDNGQEELLTSDQHCVTYQSVDTNCLTSCGFTWLTSKSGKRTGGDRRATMKFWARHTYRHRMQSMLETNSSNTDFANRPQSSRHTPRAAPSPTPTSPVASDSNFVGQAVPDAMCAVSERQHPSQHDEPASGNKPYSVLESHRSIGETPGWNPQLRMQPHRAQAQP